MKFRPFTALFIILLLAAAAKAATFSVGVSPDLIHAGEVAPGETKIVKFSVFSVSKDPLLVYMNTDNGNFDFFNKGYKEYMPQFSEEPTATWIEFISNPIEINPETRQAGRGWTDVNVILHVPENAEPGYHVVYIQPTPTIFGQGESPVGTSIVAVARVSILVNVKGNAERKGIILDTTSTGYSPKGFKLVTYFQNTGTDTIYAKAINDIYAKNGTFAGEFQSAGAYVKPGATADFSSPVDAPFAEGQYDVKNRVLFTTDEVSKTTSITLNMPITAAAAAQPTEFPWTVVLIILIIIVIIVWWLRAKR